MDYNYKDSYNEEGGLSVTQIMQYVTRIVQKWWVILLCAVLGAVVGFVVAKINYQPLYSTTMRFAIDNKRENSVSGGQTSSDVNAGILLARNYQTIMVESDTLMREVAEDSGYNITGAEVKKMISSSRKEEQSIISITFTTNDPDLTYALATSYVNNYGKVAERAFQSTKANLYDEPQRPVKANPDNSKLNYSVLGFVFGMTAVIIVLCMSIFIKDTLKSSDDVISKLNTPLLGQVINLKKADKSAGNFLITDKKTGFMFIESFKIIRTKLESLAKRHGYKVFVFTSAYENEGKTTVATNTALALAKSGKSVLLIDGDLRKPAVYKKLGVSATNEIGLSGVINGEKTLSESIKYFEKFNLFLLITNQAVSDSAELLSSDSMEEIIGAVKNEFDYVIIDTPPAGIVADSSILAQYADACVMVVRCDCTPSRRVKRTIEDMTAAGAEVVGCVFNASDSGRSGIAIPGRHRKGYGYGYGGYGYGGYGYGGYGYGYGTHKNSKRDKNKKTETNHSNVKR